MSPEHTALAKRNDRVREAAEFYATFGPKEGVDYAWALSRAKEQYAAAEATFNLLDEKAAWIVTHLGSGTGVLATVWAAAVASDRISWEVGGSALLPFLAAAVAVILAAYARSPQDSVYPASAADSARRAEYYPTAAEAEASTVGQWHYAATIMQHAADKKAAAVEHATRTFAWSIGLLVVPVVVAIAEKAIAAAHAAKAAGG